jgi:phosphatidylserine synthase
MTDIKDIISGSLSGIPIAILYTYLIMIIAKFLAYNTELEGHDEYTRVIIIFIFGLVGLFIFVMKMKILKRTEINIALFLSTLLLIYFSVIQNWHILDDSSKIVVLIIAIIYLIHRIYISNKKTKYLL